MKREIAWGVLVIAAATVYACGDDETTSDGTTSTTTSNTTSQTTSATTSNTTSQTSSSTTGGGGQGSGGNGVGGGGDCPPDPNDTMCVACAKTNCCQQVVTCASDAECGMCLACIQTSMGDLQGCVQGGDCSLQDPETQALGQCVFGACQTQCTAM